MHVIECNHVGICYITGDMKSIGFKEYVTRHLTHNYHVKEFWADKDVSFSLDKQDMLGIIGTNGAGKSTLLKAVTKILVPQKGTVKVRGQIAALLELTSGFDSHMTVRENAYLRGAMLGYTRKFMDEKYEEIIAFAELEHFQEYQFKQLSSGMKSRLAFSIACLVNPDILILDEVLSVGDGAFRKKSRNKMKEILAGGITGILVSHSVDQIRSICNKILWLDHGNQVSFGDDVKTYCDAYEEFLITKQLPSDENGIVRLANDYAKRLSNIRREQKSMMTQRFETMTRAPNTDAAVDAARNVLSISRPYMLKPKYRIKPTNIDEKATL